MGAFISERWADIAFRSYQHASLVAQSVLLATVIAVALAVVVTTVPRLEPVANAISTVGLTIPSFALLGLLIPLCGIGTVTSVAVVTFYAVLPILRNAVVGFSGVDRNTVEAARGQGMSKSATFLKVELPLAWPVILAGMRISAQMSMGIAAISAYVLGPGLGGYIFSGLSRLGGANSFESVLTGVVAIILLAFILDGLLVLLGRLTISRGINV